ncbi:hypothetical protein B0A55_13633, partial [Friedmanniomyces simplex]
GEGAQVVNGVTLSQGQAVTIGGQLFSNAPSGLVVDGTSTIALPNPGNVPTSTVFIVSGHTFAAHGVSSGYEVVNGITLAPDQVRTIDSQMFSAFSDATGAGGLLIDGSSTVLLPAPGTVTPAPVRSVGGTGSPPAATTTSGGAPSLGP